MHKHLISFAALSVLSACLTQQPADVVDKSHSFYGKNVFEYTPKQKQTSSSDIIISQPLAPLQSQKTTAYVKEDETKGYLTSKETVYKEDPKQQGTPTNTDLTAEDEEPPVASKMQAAPIASATYLTKTPLNSAQFEWPISNGKVIQRFGKIDNKFNEGMNIGAPAGTTVACAGDGKIIYIGKDIEGYGNLIIVKHNNDYMSAYAHVKDVLVERGAQVKKGESLATVGQTGNASEPQLHFSIRKGKKTINPEGVS
ncbi:MAG: murein hydrolase activator EnvC family protein [Rickettsiales bacterium]